MDAVDPLMTAARPDEPVQRAVEVVTDLVLRGYPAERASIVVQNVLWRDEAALERVPGTLETIRRDYALSRAEAVDALGRGLASSDSLQTAYNRTVEDERRSYRLGGTASRGDGSNGPGRSALAPGRLKGKGPPIGRNR
jgi:hypothetical protein